MSHNERRWQPPRLEPTDQSAPILNTVPNSRVLSDIPSEVDTGVIPAYEKGKADSWQRYVQRESRLEGYRVKDA